MLKPFLLGLTAMSMQIAPSIAQTPAQSASESQVTVSHADWSEILTKYVVVSADPDGLNRFNYGALKENAADIVKLDNYIQTLSKTAISQMSRDDQFVTYANLYNALTVQLIIENYPIKSIMRIRPTLISIGPWKKKLFTLEGEDVSLDDIEHGILREKWDEPRIHYAVNCASVGCPNLQPTAWETENLDERLTLAAKAYVNSPRGVTVRKDGRLAVSTIYKWFREDFGNSEEGIVDHLLTYAEPELAEKIRANGKIADYDYDWSLNGTSDKPS